MKIKCMGACGTVTGSSYILTSGSGRSIIIDLGMFQGIPEIDALNTKPFEYDCSQLEGAILTHAHLDHCGRLPILLQKGYNGYIWMTPPTKELAEISLLDSAKIAIQDHKQGMYDKNQAQLTIERFRAKEYRVPFQVGDFQVTFRDAGHIIGSAIVEIEDFAPNSEIRKIVFSGDLGNTPEDLVHETELIDEADVVVMESTYGDRLHAIEDAHAILQKEINIVEKTDATLLIPVFALERTQEVLHMIMHLKRDGKIREETPVFLDSPMAEKATMVYLNNPNELNDHIKQDLQDIGTPFGFSGLELIHKKGSSEGLHHHEGAKIILAGSGMMSGGRIVGHAGYYLQNPKNRLLIVGYQGEGTLGRELMDGKREVIIDKKVVQILGSINATHAMSSHADQQQLMNWIGHIKKVKKVILTHGEEHSRNALAKRISEELKISEVIMPYIHDDIDLK